MTMSGHQVEGVFPLFYQDFSFNLRFSRNLEGGGNRVKTSLRKGVNRGHFELKKWRCNLKPNTWRLTQAPSPSNLSHFCGMWFTRVIVREVGP